MTGYNSNHRYNDDMKGITTDNSYFLHFREDDDILYVDKTMYAYRLIRERGNFFFLSRPRRFGKSLFCSMLHFLFEGKKEFFKGLYIAEKTDYGFDSYPVIHLNFGNIPIAEPDLFIRSLTEELRFIAEDYGLKTRTDNPAVILREMLAEIYRDTGKQSVIIIDEYDRPLTGKMDAEEHEIRKIRDTLNDFFSAIKNSSEFIRFLFITGVVRLSNLSIFSAMNNLVDISMSPEYAAAFGYTESELEENFGEGIDEYLEGNPGKYESREEFTGRIRAYYDGYRFSPDSEVTVYNPVSIGYFFRERCRFYNYWNMTGVPTFAVELASRFDLSDVIGDDVSIPLPSFSVFDISDIQGRNLSRFSMLALLYYAGYLTIRDADEKVVSLAFPNMEVGSSFTDNLLPRYCTMLREEVEIWAWSFEKACRAGDEEKVMGMLHNFFSAFSYELRGKDTEKFYHSIFHSVFIVSGLNAVSEDRGARGRADEVLLTGDHIWVFELKMDKSADDALRQIEEKGYAEKYAYLMKPGMKMHKIGISFSTETRQIAEWKSSQLPEEYF